MFGKRSSTTLANPYLVDNFAPVMEEMNVGTLPFKGTIPPDLNGRLVRIGPNPVGDVASSKYHWFMGNGMVHGIDIRSGSATGYTNRYVVDCEVARELKRPEIPGPKRGRDSTVNTNVISVNGKIYAVVEAGGLPIELGANLESVQRSNFSGSLKAGFTAHPRRDPDTGNFHAIAYEPGEKKAVYLTIDNSGNASNAAEIELSHSPMIHDTAITFSHVVLLDLPVSFTMLGAMQGQFPYRWNPHVKARIGLIPRNGESKKVKWFDAPTCYVYHIMNAFDDGANVIIDVVKHPKTFDKNLDGPREGATSLVRWTVDTSTNKVTEFVIDERAVEFPRINESYTAKPYRFGYTASFTDGLKYGPIHKHDMNARTTEVHDFGGLQAGEPVFVPKQDSTGEDDGWILTCVFDPSSGTSQVHIIDASNFSGDSVAVIDLPVRVPFGFHGNWFADI
jgi:carotenoid cleavage dioxygenase-like enzyme